MHALPLHCHAIDLPGYGHSDPMPDPPTMAGFVEAVAAFIEQQLGGRALHLFGNSMGGVVAVDLAASRPDLVRSVTLVSPALPTHRLTRTNYAVPAVALPRIGDRLFARWQRGTVEQRVAGTLAVNFADPAGVHPLRVQELIEETRRRDDDEHAASTYLGSARSLMRSYLRPRSASPWQRLGRIEAPLLVVYGLRDRLVDPMAARRITREHPGATVAVIVNTAHVSQIEAPLEVARLWIEHIG
jgi:pimeloyl-ACP methyl ester carboxylesterase